MRKAIFVVLLAMVGFGTMGANFVRENINQKQDQFPRQEEPIADFVPGDSISSDTTAGLWSVEMYVPGPDSARQTWAMGWDYELSTDTATIVVKMISGEWRSLWVRDGIPMRCVFFDSVNVRLSNSELFNAGTGGVYVGLPRRGRR